MRVERLRPVAHLLGVAEAVLVEEVELIPRAPARRPRGRPAAGRRTASACRDLVGDGGRHVGVDAEQSRRRLQRHLLGDGVAPVAALGDVARVAEPLHQHDPGAGDADRVPAGRGRLAREAVARQRRDHQVEGVRRAPAVRGGIGQRLDDLQLLDDRARPAVRDDERQRVLVLRADVDEVDVEPVDLGDELRAGRSAAPRPCASRGRSPNSARAPASSRAARLARHPSPVPASSSRRCAGAGRPAPLPGSRT